MKNIFKQFFRRLFLYIYAAVLPEAYKEYIKLQNKNKVENEWRSKNGHNFTHVRNEISELPFPIDKVEVGKNTYGSLKVFSYGSTDEMLKIGSFCSIAPNVKFILGGMHFSNHISTYPFKAYFQELNESFSKGPIIVEDDVWIGSDAILLSGIKIGKGTIVAAGSVVTKSTLPYSIVGGNPAKLIKYRFPTEIINKLLPINYELFTSDFITNNIELLYEELNDNVLEQISHKIKYNVKA